MHNYNYKNYTQEHFDKFLESSGEIGYVESYNPPIIKVKGLPTAKPKEVVLLENGTVGQIMSMDENLIDVVSLSTDPPVIGERVCRTGQILEVGTGKYLLGKTINSLGQNLYNNLEEFVPEKYLSTDPKPAGIEKRVKINQYFETGVSIVDMLIPLGKGQRELVIGDRKTGKTDFILHTMLNQAKQGTICIYVGIGKNALDIKKVEKFLDQNQIRDRSIIVASYSSDPSALVFLTPYAAMTIAEYFMELGNDVLIILDDMTNHAKFYRELSLVARKLPGRSSYPADIFYAHSRLLERAGYFKTNKGINAITCLPVAGATEGDITGYIQTNLMSITDGHIFFDKELFLQGKRPAINYFLSVTRVGRQTQTKLKWSVGRELSTFLSLLDKTEGFVHFGAEVNEGIKSTLAMGEKITKTLFNQQAGQIYDTNLQILIFALVWGQVFKEQNIDELMRRVETTAKRYKADKDYRDKIGTMISSCDDFNKLLGLVSARHMDIV
jgi:F-type H+/Na+-transporting ATPase subunit alpha